MFFGGGASGAILSWVPTAACLPVVWWLFSNPRELGVAEARALVAKQSGRAAFWYVLAAALVDSGRLLRFQVFGAPGWACAALPLAAVVGYVAYRVRLFRTHPGILETASDELVRRWKRRFFAGREVWVFAAWVGVWVALRVIR